MSVCGGISESIVGRYDPSGRAFDDVSVQC